MDLDDWNCLDDSSDECWSEDNDECMSINKKKNKSGFSEHLGSENEDDSPRKGNEIFQYKWIIIYKWIILGFNYIRNLF